MFLSIRKTKWRKKKKRRDSLFWKKSCLSIEYMYFECCWRHASVFDSLSIFIACTLCVHAWVAHLNIVFFTIPSTTPCSPRKPWCNMLIDDCRQEKNTCGKNVILWCIWAWAACLTWFIKKCKWKKQQWSSTQVSAIGACNHCVTYCWRHPDEL